jgi:adenylate cyclase
VERSRIKPTESLDAYDLYLQALQPYYELSSESLQQALMLLRRAIEADAHYGLAKALAAYSVAQLIQAGWHHPLGAQEALRLVQEARADNPDDPLVLATYGHLRGFLAQDIPAALDALKQAVAIHPNYAPILLRGGWVHMYAEQPEAALEYFQCALRLSPLDPEMFMMTSGIGRACGLLGRFDEALHWGTQAVSQSERWSTGHLVVILALVALGRIEEARLAAARCAKVLPKFTVGYYRQVAPARTNPARLEREIAALQTAGLPE